MAKPVTTNKKGSKYKHPEVKKCNCEHTFQDERYGKNMRVHNYCAGKDNFRCTICENSK